MSPVRWRSWFAIVVLALAVVGNVLTFRPAEDAMELASPHRALVRVGSNALVDLVLDHGRNVGSRFTLDVWLREHAPHSTVVVAPGHPLVLEGLVGIARAEVEVGDHDARIGAGEAERLVADAQLSTWYWRGPREPLGSEDTTGVPAAFDRGDVGVVASPERLGPDSRFVTYWHDTVVLLVEVSAAAAAGLDLP